MGDSVMGIKLSVVIIIVLALVGACEPNYYWGLPFCTVEVEDDEFPAGYSDGQADDGSGDEGQGDDSSSGDDGEGDDGEYDSEVCDGKVPVCHQPEGRDAFTICVGNVKSLEAHLSHGDYAGDCDELE